MGQSPRQRLSRPLPSRAEDAPSARWGGESGWRFAAAHSPSALRRLRRAPARRALVRRTDSARAAADRPTRRAEGQVRAADLRAQSCRQSADRRQGRARQAPVRGPRAVLDRHHRLPLLPRPQARLHRRRVHRQGRDRQAAGAPHADAVERRLEPAAVLGRPRREPGGADPLPRRAPRRDGLHARRTAWHASRATTATRRPSRKPSRRTRASPPTTSPRRWPPTSARWSRRRPASTNGSPARRQR